MPGESPTSRATSLFDVARAAGVSHQTVSRVVNGHPSVRPETRAKVQQAIERLGYRPNDAARALVTRRTRTIGLITKSTAEYGPTSTVLGFAAAARAARYKVSISTVLSDDATSLRASFDQLLGQGVEVIVLVAARRGALAAIEDADLGLPVVTVGSSDSSRFTSVSIDQYHGARTATEHLLGLGHRRIAHLGGPPESMDASERARGWRDALHAAGLAATELVVGDWSPASGFHFGSETLDPRRHTAVFCGNDQMALGIVHALSTRGIAVPGSVSIVGFDDIPEAAYFLPPLTTMRQDFTHLGRDVMTAVLDLLDRGSGTAGATAQPEDRPKHRLPDLIQRASTGRPSHGGLD